MPRAAKPYNSAVVGNTGIYNGLYLSNPQIAANSVYFCIV
jgi:hypothetical protein